MFGVHNRRDFNSVLNKNSLYCTTLLLLLLLYFSFKLPENISVKVLWTQCAREKFISEENIPAATVAYTVLSNLSV